MRARGLVMTAPLNVPAFGATVAGEATGAAAVVVAGFPFAGPAAGATLAAGAAPAPGVAPQAGRLARAIKAETVMNRL